MKHTNIHKYNREKNRGITLIALVITIIVLIILAGITVSYVIRDNGLFDKAKSTQKIQDVASLKEALELEKAPIQVDNAGNVDLDDYLEQIQKSKKNYTLDSIERLDDNNAEIVVNDKYKFLVKDKQNGDVEIIYEGIASIGDLEISETSGTYTYPIPGEIQVTKNASGGELSVKSKNENIAKAEINGTTVTVTPGTKAGTIGIVVTSAANGEYAENRVTHTATVLNGEIKITAEPYIGNYDGKEHNALSVTTDPEDVNLSYSLNGKESSDIPKVTGADNYSVTVTASKEGYMTTTETITVTVGKNNEAGNLTLSEYSGTLTYPETKTFTVNKNISQGQLSVQSSNDNVVKAEINDTTVTLKPQAISTNEQTATITVTSAATANYEAQTAEYEVTVNQGSIKIKATAYTGSYDGTVHAALTSVTTDPTDATKTYLLDDVSTGSTIPTVTGANTYFVTVTASKEGYMTATETIPVTVNKANGQVTLSATSGVVKPTASTSFTVSKNTSSGTLSVTSNNNNVATATISGTTVTVTGKANGSATITVTSAATTNYNAASATYSITVTQSEWNYSYTGGVQSLKIPVTGKYKLEVWGASSSGKGGYSIGYKQLSANTTLYIVIGGQPNGNTGGYNGGGNGGGNGTSSSGGAGATHIATASGVLSALSSNKSAVLIVAGGGGGSATTTGTQGPSTGSGGAGGGLNGGNGTGKDTAGNSFTVNGATQGSGYAFGKGGNGSGDAKNYNAYGGGGRRLLRRSRWFISCIGRLWHRKLWRRRWLWIYYWTF